MFYFRLNKVRIIDNRERGFLFFKRDLAELKLISLINTENTDFPDLDAYIAETDPDKKRELAATLVSQVANQRVLPTINNVKDGHTITFGDTGFVLFQSDTIPRDFNWCLIALEHDDDIRDIGISVDKVLGNDQFDSFANNLATITGHASNPAFTAGTAIAKFIAQIATASLKQNKDELAGLLYMSLNQHEHYLHGERKRDKINDLTGNMQVDYSLFGT